MRYVKSIILLLVIFLFGSFGLVASALAQGNSPKMQNVALDQGQSVDHDYFAAGNQVTIDGTVNGDAYVAGGKIDVNGTINGDLIVAGGQVTVRGNVTQNIRGAGGNILIEGSVGRNVSIVGGNLTIDKAAKIAGNAVLAGGNIDVLSDVKAATIGGGNVQINSTVSGNVLAGVGTLRLGDAANILGDVEYWSSQKATFAQGAKVSGKTMFHQTAEPAAAKVSPKKAAGFIAGIAVFFSTISFVGSLILGFLLLTFIPVYSQKTAEIVQSKFWLSLLLGFIALIVTPVFVIILMVTLIGFPVGLLLLFAYAVLLYVAKLFVALAAGVYVASLAKWRLSAKWAFVLGLFLYYILGFIPILGGLLKLVVLLSGMGAVMLQKKYYFQLLRDKKLI